MPESSVRDAAEDHMSGIQEFAEHIKDTHVVKVITEGDDVCIIDDLVTDSARGFFDPGPLTSGR